MIATDEDALICDLAETYKIYDYKQLPVQTVAVFAYGLNDDSRIMLRMSGQTVSSKTMLLAQITDGVNLLLWSKTKDAESGRNKPESIVQRLIGVTAGKETTSFVSGNDFKKAREEIIKGGEG